MSANPNAPPQLAQFAFLVGEWRCEARLKSGDEWQKFRATWTGRSILDGCAIEDEYRMFGPAGETVVLGVNIRAYDTAASTWNIKWLDGLTGTWVDLGPEELGGVAFDGRSIVYVFKEKVVGHAYTRATYTNISPAHFTWRGAMSADRETWTEFMIIEADRLN